MHFKHINEMGEEKPVEELMGKRKSSPRLSAIHHVLLVNMIPKNCSYIPRKLLKV